MFVYVSTICRPCVVLVHVHTCGTARAPAHQSFNVDDHFLFITCALTLCTYMYICIHFILLLSSRYTRYIQK